MNSFLEPALSFGLGGVAAIESVLGMAIGFGLVVVVPLTAMLLAHQRRMAELISRRRVEEGMADRLEQMELAISRLTERVNDIALAIDDGTRARLQPPGTLET